MKFYRYCVESKKRIALSLFFPFAAGQIFDAQVLGRRFWAGTEGGGLFPHSGIFRQRQDTEEQKFIALRKVSQDAVHQGEVQTDGCLHRDLPAREEPRPFAGQGRFGTRVIRHLASIACPFGQIDVIES